MKVCIFILLALAVAQNTPTKLEPSSQSEYRAMIRLQNQRIVQTHNSALKRSYTMKLYDRFATMTQAERVATYLIPQEKMQKLLVGKPIKSGPSFFERTFSEDNIHVNWTDRGRVTVVKNQGYCGSCYAYAALADIESTFLFRRISVDLSEQNIIDCAYKFGNNGCEGGWMELVYNQVLLFGVANSTIYPDNPSTQMFGEHGQCRFAPRLQSYRIKSYRHTSNYFSDCSSLTRMLMYRPVAIYIAVNFDFFFYYEGIFTGCDQMPQLNHAVQMTGFSQTEAGNYWMVKNSWSEDWGNNGYIYIDRNQYDACLVCFFPSYTLL